MTAPLFYINKNSHTRLFLFFNNRILTEIALGLIFGAQFFSHALTATENSAISQGLTGCAVILKRRSTALMQQHS